jgi:hypothetical protein
MPRLSMHQRERIVNLYSQLNLGNVKGRWNRLREAAENEGIIIRVNGIRKLMNKWFDTKTLRDLPKSNVLAIISITDL